MDGAPGVVADGHHPKMCVATTEPSAAGIRCCSDDAIPCKSFCAGGTKAFAYEDARDTCEQAGMRFCTPEELDKDVCKQSGCGYDVALVWTSEECEPAAGPEYYTILDGSPGAKGDGHHPKGCAASTGQAEAGTRCCSQDGETCKSFCDGGVVKFAYEVAKARCAKEGMRLCTSKEIETDMCSRTGCQYDLALVWTSDACQTP